VLAFKEKVFTFASRIAGGGLYIEVFGGFGWRSAAGPYGTRDARKKLSNKICRDGKYPYLCNPKRNGVYNGCSGPPRDAGAGYKKG